MLLDRDGDDDDFVSVMTRRLIWFCIDVVVVVVVVVVEL